MLWTSVTLGRDAYTSSWQHLTSYMASFALTRVSGWAGLVPCAVDAVFPNSACFTCRTPAELLWRTHVFLACCFIYFCYFLFPMRTLTLDRTPINDAHELHPRAETSCACQRCYFCKQFEGAAAYGRIRVSCAQSLIRKARVYRECVWVFVHVRACARVSFPPGCILGICPPETSPRAPYLLCTLSAWMFLQCLCSPFPWQMMGAIVSEVFNNNWAGKEMAQMCCYTTCHLEARANTGG